MSTLSVETHAGPAEVLITVSGDLNYGDAAPLEQALGRALARDPAPHRITVDMAGVTFCDSVGLNGLLLARRDAQRRGIRFALARPSETVRRLLELTRAVDVFTVLPGEPPP